jgi:23S rRNA (adenine2030-N6)-methyltransferase
MNYRHAYHAGNFADVFKHALLALCLEHLKSKEKPFFVLDTHAGIGLYDLWGSEAEKTGEWQGGIGRLGCLETPELPWHHDLGPYWQAVKAENPDGALRFYPGSPRLSQRFLRPQDRMFLCELHPKDAPVLARTMRRDDRIKVENRDGYEAIKAVLPPKERRGLVLIDPPFEKLDEFATIEHALSQGLRRWATGCYAIWYPIKDRLEIASFHARLDDLGLKDAMAVDLLIRSPQPRLGPTGSLLGCGYVLINPPYGLLQCLDRVMDGLTSCLGVDASATWRKRPIGESTA